MQHVGSRNEALPQRLALVVGNGANVLPLIVQLGQFVQRLVDTRHCREGISPFDEGFFGLQVTAAVQVLHLEEPPLLAVVDIQQAVVGVPDCLAVGLRHGPGGFPLGLQGLQLGRAVFGLGTLDQATQLVEQFFFLA